MEKTTKFSGEVSTTDSAVPLCCVYNECCLFCFVSASLSLSLSLTFSCVCQGDNHSRNYICSHLIVLEGLLISLSSLKVETEPALMSNAFVYTNCGFLSFFLNSHLLLPALFFSLDVLQTE